MRLCVGPWFVCGGSSPLLFLLLVVGWHCWCGRDWPWPALVPDRTLNFCFYASPIFMPAISLFALSPLFALVFSFRSLELRKVTLSRA